jgi:hypothetical protein
VKYHNVIFAPGEKIRLRINVKTRNQTTLWLFDTGAAITCMNSRSFNAAFGMQKLKKISNAQSCVATSGDAMNSIGVYEMDLWIKERKFTHPVNVITEWNNNIIGIVFMHRNTDLRREYQTGKICGLQNEYHLCYETSYHSSHDLKHCHHKI